MSTTSNISRHPQALTTSHSSRSFGAAAYHTTSNSLYYQSCAANLSRPASPTAEFASTFTTDMAAAPSLAPSQSMGSSPFMPSAPQTTGPRGQAPFHHPAVARTWSQQPPASASAVPEAPHASAYDTQQQPSATAGPSATLPFLRDFNLVAEAAKRAQMAVVMRDLEGVSLS
ncbi:hypothetical protein L228DRAFT_238128 [Xylona heveae TC161]|uniref:Uncharacterized protein n=1 Tax=Xylona heveae (strain CBS 132557 / TC161) TaxID=1328760 RepID=A0A161TCP4_XYLHT|nr:hypothetical protein L228DRAFT_238128 [Xylona heveae TC161]KZF23577.1 hypothetical protein L228DRAFT_238128 [Xylona heveae TC161]